MASTIQTPQKPGKRRSQGRALVVSLKCALDNHMRGASGTSPSPTHRCVKKVMEIANSSSFSSRTSCHYIFRLMCGNQCQVGKRFHSSQKSTCCAKRSQQATFSSMGSAPDLLTQNYVILPFGDVCIAMWVARDLPYVVVYDLVFALCFFCFPFSKLSCQTCSGCGSQATQDRPRGGINLQFVCEPPFFLEGGTGM